MNQVRKSFARSLKSRKEKVILESICTQGDGLTNEDENVEGKWSYVQRFLLNASQTCEDMIKICKFGMETIDCEINFSSVLTDEGLCCSFNAVHSRLLFKNYEQQDHVDERMTNGEVDYMTWTPEKGYSKSENKSYPYPVKGPGSNMGLTLVLNADVDNYYCSSTSSSGFKVLLHSPIEIPKMANFGFFVSPGLETKVVITPKISKASDLIRKVPVEQRHCIFADEANLSYYNIYSKKNCEMECSSKMTEERCGCTLYYMPRTFDDGTVICNRKKASCYEKVLYNIANSDPDYSCNFCLPACFEVNYDREISSSKLGTGGFMTSETIPSHDVDYIHKNVAIVHIFFNDNAYGGYTKSELIGFTEFLSNTGGLLGLFMGFSVISLIEIVYFVSLRPYCERKRFKMQQKIKSEEIQLQDRLFNNNLKGSNSKSFLVNEYVIRNGANGKTSFYGSVSSKLRTVLRYIKNKMASAWKAIVEIFQKRSDEVQQPPFPYYD